jgi:hypothetical protein
LTPQNCAFQPCPAKRNRGGRPTAANILQKLSYFCSLTDRLHEGVAELAIAEIALRALHPNLTGGIAVSVDEFLNNPVTPLHDLSFQGGPSSMVPIFALA